MLKIFIKVMEAGIGFSFIIGLALGYLSTENFKNKYKIILAQSLWALLRQLFLQFLEKFQILSTGVPYHFGQWYQ